VQVLGSHAIAVAAETVAARAWSPAIKEWILRGLPRHVRRGDPSLVVPARGKRATQQAIDAEGFSPEVLDRVGRAVAGGDRIYVPHKQRLERLVSAACDMVDWLTSLPPDDRHIKRIDRMSIRDALAMSHEWHAEFEETAQTEAQLSEGVRVVEEWADGVRMVQLGSPAALRAEGNAMGHCVGGYWSRVSSGECRIFSLRDRDGLPHVTIEVGRPPLVRLTDGTEMFLAEMPRPGVNRIALALNDGVVQQVQGKGNRTPVPRWAGYSEAFLRTRGWSKEILPGTEAIDVYATDGRNFASAAEAVRHMAATMAKASRRERSVRRAIPSHGMAIAAACKPEERAAFDRKFVGMAFARDFAEPDEKVVFAFGGHEVRARLHRLPLGSMEVVAASLGGTYSDTAFARVRDGLTAFLDAVEADPRALHGFDLPGGCGLTPSVVSDLFLVSGLAARRETATAANRVGIDAVVRGMRDDLRVAVAARRTPKGATALSQERANLVANLLTGDPVPRFAALASSAMPNLGFQSFLPTTPPARKVAVPATRAAPPTIRAGLPEAFARFR
jgi:hypothetical protein